jgi:anti-sigma B factor antagonist
MSVYGSGTIMKIEIKKFGSSIEVIPQGRLEVGSAVDFETAFKNGLSDTTLAVGINFDETVYIDSTGIGALLRCMNHAHKKSIPFACYNLNEGIMNIFKLSQLDTCIKIIDRTEFIESYGK